MSAGLGLRSGRRCSLNFSPTLVVLKPRPPHFACFALLAAFALGGCLHIDAGVQAEIATVMGGTREVIEGGTVFYALHRRWPETREELIAGLALRGIKAEALPALREVKITREGESVIYHLTTVRGGKSEVRMNPRGAWVVPRDDVKAP